MPAGASGRAGRSLRSNRVGLPCDGGAAPGRTDFDSGRRPRHPRRRARRTDLFGVTSEQTTALRPRGPGRDWCAVIRATRPRPRHAAEVAPGPSPLKGRGPFCSPRCRCRASGSKDRLSPSRCRGVSSTGRLPQTRGHTQGCGRNRWRTGRYADPHDDDCRAFRVRGGCALRAADAPVGLRRARAAGLRLPVRGDVVLPGHGPEVRLPGRPARTGSHGAIEAESDHPYIAGHPEPEGDEAHWPEHPGHH